MTTFKCKMCGGTLEINGNESIATCEYCGTQQTLPRLDDDKRANLYDRANHFRRNNEFDKAMGMYEKILNEDNTDAEAYWSLVLCRYGIEYVEDPSTHKRVPTVNRTQFTSVFDDDNYKSALQYADSYQKSLYEAEANAINEIQKGILAISQKEEPFDVFICYKETDNNGRRTPDSVLANDLYHQLTQEGFKVFFSRITLEDKLGSAYEPYIFAALNSAKLMVVLGTKPEYFNAVWVKNEWSRYLALIKQGQKKMLIPAYKDMNPYDLPEEFSHLQAQDMSKLGFMQDLIRGIKKITQTDEPKKTVIKETVISGGNASTAPLLKRAFMFLEDGDWASADEYCEKVLDIEPENAQAYLGKLMAELGVKKQDELKNLAEPFEEYGNYQKAMRFGDEELCNFLSGSNVFIIDRNETARKEEIYQRAKEFIENDNENECDEQTFIEAAELFESIGEYKDAEESARECLEKAEVVRKDAILANAKYDMEKNSVAYYIQAIAELGDISGWKDVDEQIEICKIKIEELKAKAEKERKERERKIKKIAKIVIPTVCVLIAAFVIIKMIIIPNMKYNSAVELMEAGKYTEAIAAFEGLDGYKDSIDQIENCKIGIKDEKYSAAIAKKNTGNIVDAYEELLALDGYKDSSVLKDSIYKEYMLEKFGLAKVGDYITFGTYEQDNDEENGKEAIEWLVLATDGNRKLLTSKYGLDCKPYNEKNEDVTWENAH